MKLGQSQYHYGVPYMYENSSMPQMLSQLHRFSIYLFNSLLVLVFAIYSILIIFAVYSWYMFRYTHDFKPVHPDEIKRLKKYNYRFKSAAFQPFYSLSYILKQKLLSTPSVLFSFQGIRKYVAPIVVVQSIRLLVCTHLTE